MLSPRVPWASRRLGREIRVSLRLEEGVGHAGRLVTTAPLGGLIFDRIKLVDTPKEAR